MMVWGRFHAFIVAEIASKELRKHVRAKGVVADDDELVLKRAIAEWVTTRAA
jgi:hypothetical protein